MKADEVPRDHGFLEGFQRGAYAVDSEGRYTIVPTPGWQAETAATAVALETQDRLVLSAWEQVRAGARSPLAYHMVRRQMNPKLLSQNTGIGRLRVEWHLRPLGFSRLPERILRRYAECLNVPAGELCQVPDVPERIL